MSSENQEKEEQVDERYYTLQGQTEHTTVEHTTPIWRVAAIVLCAASVAFLGFYLEKVGHADDFATVAVVAVFFTVKHWARRRPDRVALRTGPFAKIALAIRESEEEIRAWTYDRPLRVGFAIAVGYGIAVVIAKTVVVALLAGIYSWELAVALGAAIGAVAAAPRLFSAALRTLSGPRAQTGAEDPRWQSRSVSDGVEHDQECEQAGGSR